MAAVVRKGAEKYETSTIERAIIDAAVINDGFSPSQFVRHLTPDTRLVEEVDENGAGKGTYVPRVKLPDVDKDGKAVVLDLSPGEAVKRMKEQVDLYGNMFKSNVNGGIGGTGPTGVTRTPKFDEMSPAAYADWRKKHKDLDLSKS